MSQSQSDDGLDSLIDAVIDGRCDEETLRRFEALVRDDPRARGAYLEQVRMHALLEWRHGRVGLQIEGAEPDRVPWWRRPRLRWGLAALVLIGAGLAFWSSRPVRPGHVRGGIATLVEAKDVAWAEGQSPLAVNARLDAQEIRCTSGALKIAFDSGALVTLEGPADLRIFSGMRLRADRGRLTARVAAEAKGFAIETPHTVVVDRGTEVGVEVDAAGRTGVVVFEGLVDLARPERDDADRPITRLAQGEGMRVDPAGLLSRIVAVERRPGDDEWSTGPSSDEDAVIRSVRDNIRGLGSSKYYQVVRRGLDDDAPAYVDRPHQWNGLDAGGLPEFLRGADYIMPFNDDKWTRGLEITVEVARESTLYVFCDRREQTPPWLSEQFADTGVKIGLDEGSWPDPTLFTVDQGPGRSINQVFTVWKRDMGRDETIRLGSLEGTYNNRSMYGIAAVARP
jgi:ferric-dicitrate binding protein FerR (iron transport regulator)